MKKTMAVAFIALVITTLPYLYAWSIAGPNRFFTGFLYNVEDGNSYIAKMLLGAKGEWLFTIFYTPEPHSGALLFPLHIAAGRLAGALGLPLIPAYHLLRLVCACILMASVLAFLSHLSTQPSVRQVAFLLITLGGGTGWLSLLLGRGRVLGSIPLEFWLPEAYIFQAILSFPHLALAEASLFGACLIGVKALETSSIRKALIAGGLALVMSTLVPIYFPVLALLWLTGLIWLWLEEHRLSLRSLLVSAGMFVIPLPYLIYLAITFTTNPVFKMWASQNVLPSPHPVVYLLGYGFLFPFAILGLRHIRGQIRGLRGVAIVWAVVWLLLAYVPVNPQRRLIVGAQVPLSWLAAEELARWLPRRRLRYVAFGFMISACISNGLLVGGLVLQASHQDYPVFRSRVELTAADWLASMANQGDVVLSAYETGNFLPTRAPVRVFIGHKPETIQLALKEEMVRKFFAPSTSDEWRLEFLKRYNIKWLVYGPWEKKLGSWNPGEAHYLRESFNGGGIKIFKVLGISGHKALGSSDSPPAPTHKVALHLTVVGNVAPRWRQRKKEAFLWATASPLPTKTPLFLGQNPTFYVTTIK
ncbi:MAG TPA: hypothetical protein ENG33_07465, partial [Chloroflexi bacterium]|nr:hypothetical protein [Chloroflexota bacterium]